MNAKDLLASFKKRFGKKLSEARIEKVHNNAGKKSSVERLWLSIELASFKEAVQHLCKLHPMPHFVAISGYQLGDLIELNYHFTLNYAMHLSELSFTIKVKLPKANPVLPTITGLIPGALIAEREMQEMLGVKIEGIPDSRGLFLPRDFPKTIFPWRRDETGPEKLVKSTLEGDKK